MARCGVFAAIILVSCSTVVYSQFYDLYQALQPLVQSYSTLTDRPFEYTHTTKRPRTTIRHKTEHTQKSTSSRRTPVAISGLEGPREDSRSREKTTTKPLRKTVKPQNNQHPKGATSSRNPARDIDTNINPSRIIFEEPVNNANTYYDTSNTKGPKIQYTTQNPLYNRPGVKPAPVDDRRPPITNRPQTIESEESPALIPGPNEDSMSNAERSRYIELAERMCDRYKELNTKQVQAIPLVPSPEPVQVNVSSCIPSNIPLVVGGKVVSIKQFPHMALLGWQRLHSTGYAWRCGGSLISNQFVLTAAHCAYDERDNSIVRGTPRVVQLGSSYLDDPGALVMKVASVVRHPKYVQPKSYYDLALVKLVATVTFSEVIKPACLGVPPAPGESIIATGWGRTEFGGDLSNELRSVSIPVWNDNECFQTLGTSRRLPSGQSPDSQVCAGDRKGGKDTCQGDSGGPAQIQDGCIWRVVAVTSLGRACGAPDTPALYAKVQRAFVASVAFGKLSPNDGIRRTDDIYNGGDNKRNTNRQTHANGAIDNGGDNNQWSRQTTQKAPYDNGGRLTSAPNRETDNGGGINSQWSRPTNSAANRQTINGDGNNNRRNQYDRQTTEKAIYNNGLISYDSNDRQSTQSTNGGRFNSGSNNRQSSTNSRAIDTSAVTNHRQINERDTYDVGGNNNQWNNNHRQTTTNNRRVDSSPVANHRQVNERDTYDVGGNNNQWSVNHRQRTSTNRGIDNSGNRQVNERGSYNNGNNYQGNSNRRTESNINYDRNNNWNPNQQNGENYNIYRQNENSYGSSYNSQPIWT